VDDLWVYLEGLSKRGCHAFVQRVARQGQALLVNFEKKRERCDTVSLTFLEVCDEVILVSSGA